MNQVMLVGRLVDKGYGYISIRPTSNDTDNMSIFVEIPDAMAQDVENHCEVNGIMGVKGHVIIEFGQIKIVADKISFLG